jgi:hypothetical protein
MAALFSGGRLVRRKERAQTLRSVTEKQCLQSPVRKQPSGLPISGNATVSCF